MSPPAVETNLPLESQAPSSALDLLPSVLRSALFNNATAFATQKLGDKGWPHRKGCPPDALILEHLEGKSYLGSIGRRWTSWICIDLDYHEMHHPAEVVRRYQAICACFPDTSPLVFSTPGGGLHCYWFFPEKIWTTTALNFARKRLSANGLTEQQKYLELFPKVNGALRLPLGKDCLMLDPETLFPLGNRAQCLQILLQTLQRDQMDHLDLSLSLDPLSSPSPFQALFKRISNSVFGSKINDLLRHGLTDFGTRNDSLMALNWEYQVCQGLSPSQTEKKLRAFMETHHNGCSKDWNRNRRIVYQHISRMVNNLYAKIDNGDIVRTKKKIQLPVPSKKTLQSLSNKEQDLMEKFTVYMEESRGVVIEEQKDTQVVKREVPSLVFMGFRSHYKETLTSLETKGILIKTREYRVAKPGEEKGRCRTFAILGGTLKHFRKKFPVVSPISPSLLEAGTGKIKTPSLHLNSTTIALLVSPQPKREEKAEIYDEIGRGYPPEWDGLWDSS